MKHVLVISLLLLAGCSGSPDAAPGGRTSPPVSVESPQPTTTPVIEDGLGRPSTVGVLVGSRLRDVRIALRDQGLRMDVRRRARCVPGVVLAQRPAPGAKLERGATVRLVVATAPPAATCVVPPGAAAVLALRAWALGDEPAPQFADRVRLLVANRPVRTLSAAQAAAPSEWNLPIPYAERSGVRILEALARAPMREADVPPYSCVERARALPPDLVRRLPWSWSLVTRSAEACMQVVAVQVWADNGRITDVNLLTGSP